jgi:hypothetical protein
MKAEALRADLIIYSVFCLLTPNGAKRCLL